MALARPARVAAVYLGGYDCARPAKFLTYELHAILQGVQYLAAAMGGANQHDPDRAIEIFRNRIGPVEVEYRPNGCRDGANACVRWIQGDDGTHHTLITFTHLAFHFFTGPLGFVERAAQSSYISWITVHELAHAWDYNSGNQMSGENWHDAVNVMACSSTGCISSGPVSNYPYRVICRPNRYVPGDSDVCSTDED